MKTKPTQSYIIILYKPVFNKKKLKFEIIKVIK